MRHQIQKLIASILIFLTFGCASYPHVAKEYREALEDSDTTKTSNRTVLVFLIDGLPALSLKSELANGKLPTIKDYFLKGQSEFQLARTPFPSLTFPGIGSLLTERPVNEHGIYGNHMLKQGRNLSFESPQQYDELNKMIRGKTVFRRLREKGFKTAAINFNFNKGTDARMELYDLEVLKAIQEKRYSDIDKKLIGSLHALLTDTQVEAWPDFIFVHLVGVDFTSHDKGPTSEATKNYLAFLDKELKPVLELLKSKEKQREIVSLLTADHGYDKEVTTVLDLEPYLYKADYRFKILNEGRYMGIYFPEQWSQEKRAQLMASLSLHPQVDIVAHETAHGLLVESKAERNLLTYSSGKCREGFAIAISEVRAGATLATGRHNECPEKLNGITNQKYYPFFLSNLSYYFKTPGHPDAIIIPKAGVALKSGYVGLHGGPTPQEVFVPLLSRNAKVEAPSGAPPLWDLLRFL